MWPCKHDNSKHLYSANIVQIALSQIFILVCNKGYMSHSLVSPVVCYLFWNHTEKKEVIQLSRLTVPVWIWGQMRKSTAPVGLTPASFRGLLEGWLWDIRTLYPQPANIEGGEKKSPALVRRQPPVGLPLRCLAFNLTYLMGDWLHLLDIFFHTSCQLAEDSSKLVAPLWCHKVLL